jgi:hypothetical protein
MALHGGIENIDPPPRRESGKWLSQRSSPESTGGFQIIGQDFRVLDFSQSGSLNQGPSESRIKLAGAFRGHSERTRACIEAESVALSQNSKSLLCSTS